MTISPTPPDLDRVFRALAHSGRRYLLARLAQEGGRTLGELSGALPMTRQAVSQHLELLESADLVVTRWQGREKLHYLNPAPLAELQGQWLAPLVTRESRVLTDLRDRLERSGSPVAADHGGKRRA